MSAPDKKTMLLPRSEVVDDRDENWIDPTATRCFFCFFGCVLIQESRSRYPKRDAKPKPGVSVFGPAYHDEDCETRITRALVTKCTNPRVTGSVGHVEDMVSPVTFCQGFEPRPDETLDEDA